MSELPLSDTELAELHALALLHGNVVADAEPEPLPFTAEQLAKLAVDAFLATDPAEVIDVAPRLPKMGPSGAQNIRAFLEAKQAEADAKAAAG
jgi:hypothetical protein